MRGKKTKALRKLIFGDYAWGRNYLQLASGQIICNDKRKQAYRWAKKGVSSA